MTPDPTPDDVRELLGAYALDALDPDERAQVDALLLTDASARAELHELEHAAAWLGHASLRPPVGAWDAIAADVERDLAADRPGPSAPRQGPKRISRWLVAAAAVVVLAIGAVGVFTLVDGTSSSDSVATQYEAARRDPSARAVTLRSADGAYSARAVVLRDRTGFLAGASMPVPRAGRSLQLWSITPDGPVSVGLLRGADVQRFRVADATTALAITNEPRGGSPAPTGAPVVEGTLPAAQ